MTTADNSVPVLTHVNSEQLSEPDDQYQFSELVYSIS